MHINAYIDKHNYVTFEYYLFYFKYFFLIIINAQHEVMFIIYQFLVIYSFMISCLREGMTLCDAQSARLAMRI